MPTQDFAIGGAAVSITNGDMGLQTEAGCSVTVSTDVHLHKSSKYSSPVKASIIGRTIELEMELAEVTLAHLAKVVAGITVNGGVYELGGMAGVNLPGVVIKVTPYDGSYTWRIRSAVCTKLGAIEYSAKGERVYKATFTGLVDTTQAAGSEVAEIS